MDNKKKVRDTKEDREDGKAFLRWLDQSAIKVFHHQDRSQAGMQHVRILIFDCNELGYEKSGWQRQEWHQMESLNLMI